MNLRFVNIILKLTLQGRNYFLAIISLNMETQCVFKARRGEFKGRQCNRKVVEDTKFCKTHIRFDSTEVPIEEKYNVSFSDAKVLSYEIKEVGKGDHVIWMSFALKTDIGDFTGEEVDMEHEADSEQLVAAIFKPDFGDLLKTQLLLHNDKLNYRC